MRSSKAVCVVYFADNVLLCLDVVESYLGLGGNVVSYLSGIEGACTGHIHLPRCDGVLKITTANLRLSDCALSK